MKPAGIAEFTGSNGQRGGSEKSTMSRDAQTFFFLVNKRRGRHPRPRKQYAITWEKNQANHPLEVRTSWLPGGRRAWVRRGAGG